MNAHSWTKMALASALLVWGAAGQAQTSSSGAVAGQGAGSSHLQTRPAPISGKVSSDPAAVALRPASQVPTPVTSKATQVPPPANPNEPLFATSSSPALPAAAAASASGGQKAPITTKQREPHVDRTEGVKKSNKTAPRQHEKKVAGKPLHADHKQVGGQQKKDHKDRVDKTGKHAAATTGVHHMPAHPTAQSKASAVGVKAKAAHGAATPRTPAKAHHVKPQAVSATKPAQVHASAPLHAKAKKAPSTPASTSPAGAVTPHVKKAHQQHKPAA